MRVHHLALLVSDVTRVAAFYRDVLRLDVIPAARAGVAWFSLGDTILMIEPLPVDALIVHSDGEVPTSGFDLLALTIEPHTRGEWEQRLAELHVPIDKRTDYTLYVRDPEGNRVGLSHYPKRAL